MTDLMHINNARLPEQKAKMEEIARRGICPFCRKHFEEYHREPILWESSHWLVSPNDWPYPGSQVHLLIIPKKHIRHIVEIGFWGMVDLLRALRWMSKRFNIQGGSFLMRFGDMRFTGATVAHLHAHVIVGVEEGPNTEPIKQKIGFARKTNVPSE